MNVSFYQIEQEVASRVCKNWIEERMKESVSFESVIKPSDSDHDLLASNILSFINLVMNLEEEGSLPSDEEVRSFLIDDNDDEQINHWPTTIPQEYGARKLVIPNNNPHAQVNIASSLNHDEDNEQLLEKLLLVIHHYLQLKFHTVNLKLIQKHLLF